MSLAYPISDLPKEVFSSLCISLLKLEISPAVTQVTHQGQDGLRDAFFNGGCITKRYEWTGNWIFQFKQYQTELTVARNRCLGDFRRELEMVIKLYGAVINYVFITSVPLSGVPSRGTFDRVKKIIAEVTARYEINVDLWDGLEICNLIDLHYDRLKHFFPNTQIHQIYSTNSRDAVPGLLYINDIRANQNISTFEEYRCFLRHLLPLHSTILGPGSQSPLWGLLQLGKNQDLRDLCLVLMEKIRTNSEWISKSGDMLPLVSWVKVIYALTLTRFGQLLQAEQYLKNVLLEENIYQYPELQAWCYNVLSIIYGKLESDLLDVTSNRAIELASSFGYNWLGALIRLRLLHKQSWNYAENGTPIDNSYFESLLSECFHSLKSVKEEEKTYIDAVSSSYLALHYGWQERELLRARKEAIHAINQFMKEPDISEIARMKSELGRMILHSSANQDEVRHFLMEGAELRARIRDLARLRYDLLWLAESYLISGRQAHGNICAGLGLLLHVMLYGERRVDLALQHKLIRIINRHESEHMNEWKEFIRMGDGIYSVLQEITGVNVFQWLEILPLSLVPQVPAIIGLVSNE